MKKNYYFILSLFVTILNSCGTTNQLLQSVTKKQTEFKAIDPIDYGWNIIFFDSLGQQYSKTVAQCTKDEILTFLLNENVLVSILEQTTNGEINLGTAAISESNKYYRIVMDYSKNKTVIPNANGSAKVGVGLRLVAKIKSLKGKINLGDLFAIGGAAEAGYLEGTLSIEIIGIKSKEVTTIIPFPSEINQTTIQNAMQALVTIKSKIYDNETAIIPQVIAIKPSNEDIATENLLIRSLGFKTDNQSR